MANSSTLDTVFQKLVIGDEGRACRDIPDSACQEEPRNFFTHVAALSLSKSSDGLIDPKLVLSWLMTFLGAPAYLIGFLVPVRESGALLPQLFTAGAIRQMPLRKYAWTGGAVVQGLAAIAIAAIALMFEGALAGWLIIVALAILATARSVCSVSYKDVLGKTVSKSRRGSATGLAGSISVGSVILFAVLLIFDIVPRAPLVISGIFLAGAFWITGAAIFATLEEAKGATEGGKAAISAALENILLLKTEPQLRQFILTRGLLTATALAPPFMVAAGAQGGQQFESLGLLVLASAGASLVSSFVWGRLADRSSRKVLALSGLIAAIILAATAFAALSGWLANLFLLPALLFVLMISYQGVRLGRSTHLVDMATEDTRAAYTALSNTVIG
ncbi:MAG: MFS transporter, partial [Pseudomonadota bacterium]